MQRGGLWKRLKEVRGYVPYSNLICLNWRAFSTQCEQFSANTFLEMFRLSGFNIWWVDTYVNEICLLPKLMLKWNYWLASHVHFYLCYRNSQTDFLFQLLYSYSFSPTFSSSTPKRQFTLTLYCMLRPTLPPGMYSMLPITPNVEIVPFFLNFFYCCSSTIVSIFPP